MSTGPSLRRLLLGVNALVLLVPLMALLLFQVYEGHLVAQTERRLIAESALIGEAWRARWLDAQEISQPDAPAVQPPGVERFFPHEPVIDLSKRLSPGEPTGAWQAEDRSGPAWRAGEGVSWILQRAKLVNLSGARVFDPAGCVVASTADDVGRCVTLPEVQLALEGRYHAVARARLSDEPAPPLGSMSRRGAIRVFTATPVFSGGRVVAVVRMSRTSLDPMEALWAHRRMFLWAVALTVALTGAVSFFFAWTISRPMRAITAAASAIARGDVRAPFQLKGVVPAEVRTLSEALDTMTLQLEARARYIAEFAANISHELKTPLTSVGGAAELLREHHDEMTPTQRDRFLGNIEVDVQRMQRLVTRLLRLARLEHAPTGATAQVNVAAVVNTLAARYGERIQVVWTQPNGPLKTRPLDIPEDHLREAIGNLLDNAAQHGEGPITFTIDAQRAAYHFKIHNLGPCISDANRARIFERFFTTDRDGGGTGLGLAIVQAIAHRHRGGISFESDAAGTTFTLRLPG